MSTSPVALRPSYGSISVLRAFAALWVVITHCMIWGGAYWHWLPNPKLAVDLFMMISGFVMMVTTQARHLESPRRTQYWYQFWIRRVFRIAPAYYLSLAIAVALSSYYFEGYQEYRTLDPAKWSGDTNYDPYTVVYSAKNIWLHLSFVFGLMPDYAWSTFLPDWSLSLEMQFYVVFPLLLLGMTSLGMVRVALITAAVAWVFIPMLRPMWQEPSLLLFKLQTFMAGMLAFAAVSATVKRALLLFAAGCVLIALDPTSNWRTYVIYLVMLVAARLEYEGRMPVPLSNLMQGRAANFAAEASYGVYLFHGFFISGFGLLLSHGIFITLDPVHRVEVMIALVVPCVYALAYVSYRLVERPGISLGNRLARKLDDRVAPVPVGS